MVIEMDLKRYFCFLYEHKIVNFTLSFLASLGIFLLTQPEPDEAPKIGFSTVIYNKQHCYNIHHWVYMMSSSLLIVSVVIISDGNFVPPLVMTLGFLTGGSFSDLYYKHAFDFTSCDDVTNYKSTL
tara:strand:+ start:194 stop:571 length:378 start_codon:yes stop_codon:yes gene_type:complete